MRGRRSVRCGQTCEYRKARLILTHDPGEELFLGALHPAAALIIGKTRCDGIQNQMRLFGG